MGKKIIVTGVMGDFLCQLKKVNSSYKFIYRTKTTQYFIKNYF